MILGKALCEVVALNKSRLSGGLDIKYEEAGTERSQLVEVSVSCGQKNETESASD